MKRRSWFLIAAAAAGVACGEGKQPGDVFMQIVTTRTDVGAVNFRLFAAQPNAIDTVVAACSGCTVSLLRIGPAEVRGVVTGAGLTGPILRLTVTDVAVPVAYTAQVIEAAIADFSLVQPGTVSLQVVQ